MTSLVTWTMSVAGDLWAELIGLRARQRAAMDVPVTATAPRVSYGTLPAGA